MSNDAVYLQHCPDDLLVQTLHGSPLGPLLFWLFFWYLIPDLGVYPQCLGQGQAGFKGGDAATHRAADCLDHLVGVGQFLQTRDAEGVTAVQQAWDPMTS